MGKAPKPIGIDMIHVAKLTADGATAGTVTYGTVTAVPEAVQCQVNPANFAGKYHSDNAVSEIFAGTTGAQVQLTIAGAEQEVHAAILGRTLPAAGDKYIIDDMGNDPAPVAFGYRRKIYGKFDGRQKYRYVWLLKVTFTPPNEQTDTQTDGVSVQNDQYSGEALALDAFKPTELRWRVTMDNWRTGITQAMENAFFTTVQTKQPT